MAEILENQVLHTLGQVIDEQSDRNIVSLGIVKDITVSEGQVRCILEFQDNDQKKNSRIFEDSKKAIEEIPGVTKVDIITTFHREHSKDEDKKFEFDVWYNPKNNLILKVTYNKMGSWEYRLRSFE